MSIEDKIKLEILEASHFEHLKFFNDSTHYLPSDHPKRKAALEAANKIAEEINIIQPRQSNP